MIFLMSGRETVYILFESDFGKSLPVLSSGSPLWLVNSVESWEAAKKIWEEVQSTPALGNVTVMNYVPEISTEERLSNTIEDVDLHYGTLSSEAPYSELVVIGAQLTDRIRQELLRLGFELIEETPKGFKARRKSPV